MTTRKQQLVKAATKRRAKMRVILKEERGGACERCGYNRCMEALEWHHLDPAEKESRVLGSTASIARQRAEAEKCILLCANCHREIHAEWAGYHTQDSY